LGYGGPGAVAVGGGGAAAGGFGYGSAGRRDDSKFRRGGTAGFVGVVDEPKIVAAARGGHLQQVQSVFRKMKMAPNRRWLNRSRTWTEADGGGKQKRKWHGLTAVTTAAMAGHHDVVEYLLKQGADPTLRGFYHADVHYDALAAAKVGLAYWVGEKWKIVAAASTAAAGAGGGSDPSLDGNVKSVEQLLGSFNNRPNKVAVQVSRNIKCFQRCVALIEAALPFWSFPEKYGESHDTRSNLRETLGFPNQPSDANGLEHALDAVDDMEADGEVQLLAEQLKSVLNLRPRQAKNKKNKTSISNNNYNKHGSNKDSARQIRNNHNGRRHSEPLRDIQPQQGQQQQHHQQQKQQKQSGDGRKKDVCWYYLAGCCMYGDSCNFIHEQ